MSTFATIPGALSFAQLEAYWIVAGGDPSYAPTMAGIAVAESGGVPDNTQKGQPAATTGWGLWQITPGTSEPQVGTNAQLNDPMKNAEAAVAKFNAAKAAGEDPLTPWTGNPIGQVALNSGGALSLASAEALTTQLASSRGFSVDYSGAADTTGKTATQALTWAVGLLKLPISTQNVLNGSVGLQITPGGTLSDIGAAGSDVVSSVTSLSSFLSWITSPTGWTRVLEGLLGVGLIVVGGVIFFHSTTSGQKIEGAATAAALG